MPTLLVGMTGVESAGWACLLSRWRLHAKHGAPVNHHQTNCGN